MQHSRITTLLGIQYPVIQAAMTWLTSAEFVAAVSKAGGLGVLGPNAGQRELATSAIDAAEKMRAQIRKVKQLTDKPFAVNYILPNRNNDESYTYAGLLLDIILEENVGVVVMVSHGDESDKSSFKRLKDARVKILYRDTSPTVQRALQAQKMGVDAVIVTGYEAGGLLSHYQISTHVLLSQVIEVVSIPVIAAGGIYNAKTAKAVFAIGAEGVYMGTRFINTFECPAAQRCKETIITVRSEDLVILTKSTSQLRVIGKRNDGHKMQLNTEVNIGHFRQSMLLGDVDNAYICVSESAGGIHNIISCQALIEEIMGIAS